MNNEQRYDIALSFWTASFQYLMLVENVARKTASQGNVWVMIHDFKEGPITPKEYAEGTRWSDHAIIIPLLFNLLHGIELLVKGFLLVDPAETVEREHNICELCARFKPKYSEETTLNNFFDKYTNEGCMPELLRRFLADNSLQVDGLYQALRYPSPDFLAMRHYSTLKYQGQEGTAFFTELCQDIRAVRIASVRLGREWESKK
jgi:hypothetical protein